MSQSIQIRMGGYGPPTTTFSRALKIIGDDIEAFAFQRCLRLFGHVRELGAVGADVDHLVRHDQMMLGINRDLHVVADDDGAAPARRHRAAVGIGERELLIRRSKHLLFNRRKLSHLFLQLRQLLPQAYRLK